MNGAVETKLTRGKILGIGNVKWDTEVYQQARFWGRLLLIQVAVMFACYFSEQGIAGQIPGGIDDLWGIAADGGAQLLLFAIPFAVGLAVNYRRWKQSKNINDAVSIVKKITIGNVHRDIEFPNIKYWGKIALIQYAVMFVCYILWRTITGHVHANDMQEGVEVVGRVALKLLSWAIPFAVGFVINYAYGRWRWTQSDIDAEELTKPKHYRGPKLLTQDELIASVAQTVEETGTEMGAKYTDQLALPTFVWNMNIGFCGATRSGKTQSMTPIVLQNYKLKIPQIIHDTKGDYFSKCGQPEDLIFCPLDVRHMGIYEGWTIYNDIENIYEVELVAKAFFPDNPDAKDQFWITAPRDIFVGILRYCHFSGKKTNKEIWETACKSLDELITLFRNTPGCERAITYIEDKRNSSGDLRAVLMSRLQALEYVADSDGEFSIKKWLENPKGNIYCVNYPEIADAIKPILTTFLDLTMLRILGLKNDKSRRLALVLDEAPFLGKLTSLVRFISLAAEKGTQVVLGYQSNSMFHSLYGKEDMLTILANLGSKVVFRLADPETAKWYSDFFGEITEIIATESLSQKLGKTQEGGTTTQQPKDRALVSKEVLMGLKVVPPGPDEKLNGREEIETRGYYESVAKFASFDAVWFKRAIVIRENKEAAFEPKPSVSLDYIKAKYEEAKKVLTDNIPVKKKEEEENTEIEEENSKEKKKKKKDNNLNLYDDNDFSAHR